MHRSLLLSKVTRVLTRTSTIQSDYCIATDTARITQRSAMSTKSPINSLRCFELLVDGCTPKTLAG
eukprot:6482949-Amphidinium_carterae.1